MSKWDSRHSFSILGRMIPSKGCHEKLADEHPSNYLYPQSIHQTLFSSIKSLTMKQPMAFLMMGTWVRGGEELRAPDSISERWSSCFAPEGSLVIQCCAEEGNNQLDTIKQALNIWGLGLGEEIHTIKSAWHQDKVLLLKGPTQLLYLDVRKIPVGMRSSGQQWNYVLTLFSKLWELPACLPNCYIVCLLTQKNSASL